MKEEKKTKKQLIDELTKLRKRITELEISEAELVEVKRVYQDLIENERDIIYALDDKGIITFANPAVETILGYKPKELMGKNFMMLIPKEIQEKTRVDFQNLLKTGEITAETVLLDKKGQPHFVEYSSTTIKEGEKVIGTRGIVRDISERKQVEAALKESEEKYKSLAEQSLVGIFILQDGITVYANQGLSDLIEYPLAEILNWKSEEFSKVIHPEDRSFVIKQGRRKQIGAEDVIPHYSYRMITKTGDVRVVELYSRRMVYRGKPAVQGMLIDITEHKRAEEELKKHRDHLKELVEERTAELEKLNKELKKELIERQRAEKSLRRIEEEQTAILNSMREHVVYQDREMRIIYTNRAAAESVGLVPDKLVGHHCYEIWPRRNEPCEDCPVVKARETGLPQEKEMTTPDGRVWLIRGYPVQDTKGDIISLVEVTLEITERKMMEEAIRESEEKYRNLIEQSLQGILIIQDGRIVFTNSAFAEISGYTSKELLALTQEQVTALIHPDDQELVWKRFADRLAKKSVPPRYEYRGIKKDGSTCWLEMYAQRVEFKGRPAIQGAIIDITDRKKAVEALRESEKKYRELVENLQEGVWIIDKDAYTTFVNPRMAEILGYSVDEMQGKHLLTFMDKKEVELCNHYLDRRKRGIKEQHDFKFLRKDGTLVYTKLDTMSITDDEGNYTGAIASVVDITKRKQVEEAIKNAARDWTKTFDSIKDTVSLLDAEGRILRCNKAMASFLGKPFNQIVGKHYYKFVHGTSKPIKGCPFERMKKTKLREAMDLQLNNQWFNITVDPLLDKGGNLIGAVHIIEDITERKKMEKELQQYAMRLEQMVEERTKELKKAQKKLIQSEKMAVLGQVAAGIGHDLRNPMGIISNATYYLDSKINEDQPKLRKHIAIINHQIELSKNIINNLMNFARPIELSIRPVDIPSLVKDVLSNFRLDKIKVFKKFPPQLPKPVIDKEQFRQVFVNLVNNAFQAMYEGGKLTISAKESKGKLMIEFSDTGKGISPKKLPHIFEPFFTTRAKGIGIGLTLCQKIVEKHKGSIEVTSKLGKGTTFTVVLPIKEEKD